MKRLFLILITALIVYVIYFDLTKGTLPAKTVTGEKLETKKQDELSKITFFEYKVKPGDTVLSIVERKLGAGLPVSISKVVTDFTELNQIRPENMQIDKTYKFPLYKEKDKN